MPKILGEHDGLKLGGVGVASLRPAEKSPAEKSDNLSTKFANKAMPISWSQGFGGGLLWMLLHCSSSASSAFNNERTCMKARDEE